MQVGKFGHKNLKDDRFVKASNKLNEYVDLRKYSSSSRSAGDFARLLDFRLAFSRGLG